jgi:hypothetical protein
MLKAHFPNVGVFNAQMKQRKHREWEALPFFLFNAKVDF